MSYPPTYSQSILGSYDGGHLASPVKDDIEMANIWDAQPSVPLPAAAMNFHPMGMPEAAVRKTFNIEYFKPREESSRRWFFGLIVVSLLVIAGLIAGLVVLANKNQHPVPYHNTASVTATTMVPQATTILLTPTPDPVPTFTAHAACSPFRRPSDQVGIWQVSVWTNYIEDLGAALQYHTRAWCEGAVNGTAIEDWTTDVLKSTVNETGGSSWVSDQKFDFVLGRLEDPKRQLGCVVSGIIDAGGPKDTHNCTFRVIPSKDL